MGEYTTVSADAHVFAPVALWDNDLDGVFGDRASGGMPTSNSAEGLFVVPQVLGGGLLGRQHRA